MSKELDEFIRLQKEQAKKGIKPQIVWATVKSVDWSNKTMIATSVIDGLDYFNVLIGLGDLLRKPKVGAKCLLGVIGNNVSATFLIECEAYEELVINVGQTVVRITNDGVVIKKDNESLKDVLSELITEVSKINPSTPANVPVLTTIKNRLNTILR